jgi:hypothetical protein
MIALASSVWKSLWDVENTLRSGAGWLLSDLIAEYDGPTLNEGFCTDDAVVKYIDIDSIDTADGLGYADELLYSDRPSRAKYQVQEGTCWFLTFVRRGERLPWSPIAERGRWQVLDSVCCATRS